MKRYELSDKQWERIKGLLPPERKGGAGRPAKDNRLMLSGILYWLNTGVPWRDLPERFGPWGSVYTRFSRWTRQGVWESVSAALIEQDVIDETALMPRTAAAKARRQASGAKKGHAAGTRAGDEAE